MGMKAIALPREMADKELRRLLRSDSVDRTHRITADGNFVYVPLLTDHVSSKYGIVDLDPIDRTLPGAPVERVKEKAACLGIPLEAIPERWVRYGDSIVIRYDGPEPSVIAGIFSGVLGVKSVYRYRGGVRYNTRKPSVELLFGPGGSVTHLENGIRYTFDPAEIMFSPGNVGIRTSMKHLNVRNKTVFDMFAGIGYFSIPIAKYGSPNHIYAAEINPVSYGYLESNIAKNKVKESFTTYNDDCKSVTLHEKVDLIIMGHYSSPSFLQDALKNLNPGGIIMIHHLVSTENLPSSAAEIEKKLPDICASYKILSSKVVKSYSPHHWHVVTEVQIA
ncbi:Protein of unknown function Met10 [mine drainage metagenome]|uniref:SAM-dependent methyltransferase TRM5/TYW2-type domain-containing protein n=1 Tax=mine drainage metagenome TaxID=410659 RepID=T1BU33_9ZZZZ